MIRGKTRQKVVTTASEVQKILNFQITSVWRLNTNVQKTKQVEYDSQEAIR